MDSLNCKWKVWQWQNKILLALDFIYWIVKSSSLFILLFKYCGKAIRVLSECSLGALSITSVIKGKRHLYTQWQTDIVTPWATAAAKWALRYVFPSKNKSKLSDHSSGL